MSQSSLHQIQRSTISERLFLYSQQKIGSGGEKDRCYKEIIPVQLYLYNFSVSVYLPLFYVNLTLLHITVGNSTYFEWTFYPLNLSLNWSCFGSSSPAPKLLFSMCKRISVTDVHISIFVEIQTWCIEAYAGIHFVNFWIATIHFNSITEFEKLIILII